MASRDRHDAWYDDVRRLWSRPTTFFPTRWQTDGERLDAVVRLLAYCALAATAVSGNPRYLAVGLLGASAVSLAHRATRRATRDGGGRDVPGVPEAFEDDAPSKTTECTPPTWDNPFMNATVGSLMLDPARPPACPYDSVAPRIWKGFDDGLFKDVGDVYNADNSQRQFYTMPVTTAAPDTIAFANFCYGVGGGRKTCKEDPAACAPWLAARS